jgi:hypothetical protein
VTAYGRSLWLQTAPLTGETGMQESSEPISLDNLESHVMKLASTQDQNNSTPNLTADRSADGKPGSGSLASPTTRCRWDDPAAWGQPRSTQRQRGQVKPAESQVQPNGKAPQSPVEAAVQSIFSLSAFVSTAPHPPDEATRALLAEAHALLGACVSTWSRAKVGGGERESSSNDDGNRPRRAFSNDGNGRGGAGHAGSAGSADSSGPSGGTERRPSKTLDLYSLRKMFDTYVFLAYPRSHTPRSCCC